jgi:protein SCO1/2
MSRHRTSIFALFLAAVSLLGVSAARAQFIPDALKDIGVDEKLDAQLPMDATFTNEMGQKVKLRDLIIPGKPAILQLSYFGCPMLCDLVSKGMLATMQDLDLEMGKDFSVINISFDKRETRNDAFLKKKGFTDHYSRPGAASAWHFLVGDEPTVHAVTSTVGFKYKWLTDQQQFSHPAVLMVITPEGHVSRYLYGVQFPKDTLRLSLVEAASGKVGSTLDKALLVCLDFDAKSGTYKLAMGVMRLGGAFTTLVLGGWIIWMFRKERRLSREMNSAA